MSVSMSREQEKKFGSLEIGRFVAAMLVVLCHVAPESSSHAAAPDGPVFGGLVFPGPLGVQFFFVLSGFVMVCAHHGDFGQAAAIPRFWWRRACRIYPAYWLALLIPVYYLYGAITPGIALHLFSLEPGLMRPHDEYILAAWSMRYEVAFYLLLGLAMLPYIGKPFLALWIFVTYWRWCWPWFPFTVLPIHPAWLLAINKFASLHAPDFVAFYQLYFFVGLGMGLLFVKTRPGAWAWGGMLAAGTVGCVALLPGEGWGVTYGTPIHVVFMAAAFAGIIGGLAGLERLGLFRMGRWAGRLGAVSYPLYVLHMPLMILVAHVLPLGHLSAAGLYLHFALLTAFILAVSALATFLFDQPVQRLLRRLTRRIWRPAAPPLAAEA